MIQAIHLDRIESAAQSDVQRFEELVSTHQRRAYSMALQLTRNVSDAEDLLQETFLKAWRGFDGYVTSRPFLNWILRIMQRAYLDLRRRDNPIRRAESLNSILTPKDVEYRELSIPDQSPTPDDELIHQEWTVQLHGALEQLPEVYRSAIQMCDLEQMSYVQIATLQNTTVGTVRSRIHRGRKLLRDICLKNGLNG